MNGAVMKRGKIVYFPRWKRALSFSQNGYVLYFFTGEGQKFLVEVPEGWSPEEVIDGDNRELN